MTISIFTVFFFSIDWWSNSLISNKVVQQLWHLVMINYKLGIAIKRNTPHPVRIAKWLRFFKYLHGILVDLTTQVSHLSSTFLYFPYRWPAMRYVPSIVVYFRYAIWTTPLKAHSDTYSSGPIYNIIEVHWWVFARCYLDVNQRTSV